MTITVITAAQDILKCIADADDIATGPWPKRGTHVGYGIHVPQTDSTSSPGWTNRRVGPWKTGSSTYVVYADDIVYSTTLDVLNSQFSKLVSGGYSRAEISVAINALSPWSSYSSETLIARIIGDTQTPSLGRQNSMITLSELADKPIAIISGGDLVADTPTQSSWDLLLSDLSVLADPTWTSNVLPRFYGVPGNHDVATTKSLWKSNLPKQDIIAGNSCNYTFSTGPIRWVVLNTTEGSLTYRTEQRNWLSDVLANSPEPWIIPYWHVRTYPADTLTEGADWGSKGWSLSFVSRIEAFGKTKCPVVLHAHSHIYERTYPMILGARDDINGIVYITAPATSAYTSFNPNLTRITTITNSDTGEERTDVADASNFAANVPAASLGFLEVYASTTTLRIDYKTLSAPSIVVDSVSFSKT